VGATLWDPPAVTSGYGAAVAWTPWTGWAVGFGFGLAFGAAVSWSSHCCWGYCPAPYWGAMPYAHYYGGAAYGWHGAAVGGPGGWAATSTNGDSRWGTTRVVMPASAGYNAWTGNAWSSQVAHSYNSVTGRVSAGQRAAVQNVYTGNYAYGKRGATYNPTTGVAARGGTVTYGNAYTGQQNTASGAHVSGPGGQSASAARVSNNYYATHDGNVDRNTGSGRSHYDNGSWNNVRARAQMPAQQQARQMGDARSAASSWGSGSWGGGFNRSSDRWGGAQSGGSWDRSGGGWDGGGWDRGGGWGGGGRSFGGGGFGGRRGTARRAPASRPALAPTWRPPPGRARPPPRP